MSNADTNKKKLDLIAWINQLSDVNLIVFLDGLRNSRTDGDWWQGLSATEKELILKGIKDAEKGNLVNSSKFWNEI